MELEIYISNLAAYTEGELIGKWVSLPMDENDLETEINSIMRPGTDDEEFAIHDYEGPFRVSEHDNPFELNRQLDELVNFDISIYEDELEALLEIIDLDNAIEALKRDEVHFYHPEKRGWAGLAEELVYECGYMEIPKHLISYIDFEMLGRDLEYSGSFYIAGNGIVVEYC